MSESSRDQRERLKEEYKDHYRKIRDAGEKLRSSSYARKAGEAVNQMNADDLLESVDHFLGKVRYKMASIEAKLDLALDDYLTEAEESEEQQKMDQKIRDERAKSTLQQIKKEMGMLYDDLEQQAEELQVKKTVGPQNQSDSTTDQ